MKSFFGRRAVVIATIFIVLAAGFLIYVLINKNRSVGTEPVVVNNASPTHTVIGLSVQGRAIEAYEYGNGATRLVFIGGIHGGYEWNSVVLAYEFMDYLTAHPEVIPKNLTVAVIPSVNPDGVYKVIGKQGRFTIADAPKDISQELGRFNSHQVDLNRNFDCKWKPQGVWRGHIVSAGSAPFSEPEARAIRDFILKNRPAAVVFWHSQSNAVYASECTNGILAKTREIMNIYSQASGYPAIGSFSSYEVTGDAGDWLASIGISAITVELKAHETIEWEKNLAGIKALFEYYK